MISGIPDRKVTTLSGITWDHPRGYLPLDRSSKRYEQLKNVCVFWEKRSLKDFGDMSVEILAEKYDLLIIDHPHIAAAANSACLLKLDGLLSKDELALFASNSVGPSYLSYYYKEHQWALPIDAACQVAAYRPDLLGSSIPQTWEDVFSLASTLHLKKKFIGIALCPTDCNCTFLTLSAQFNNAPAVHKNELISQDIGVRILEHMQMLKKISHPDCLYWNPIRLYDHMIANDDVCYSPLGFGYVNYATEKGKRKLKFAGIPGISGALLGGAGIAISSKCKNIDAAVSYIKWVCDPEYQKTRYLADGGQPAQLEAWEDVAANKLTGNFFSDTLATIDQAYMRPRETKWPLFQEYLGNVIHDFLTYEKTPKTTIAEINKAYKEMEIGARY